MNMEEILQLREVVVRPTSVILPAEVALRLHVTALGAEGLETIAPWIAVTAIAAIVPTKILLGA